MVYLQKPEIECRLCQEIATAILMSPDEHVYGYCEQHARQRVSELEQFPERDSEAELPALLMVLMNQFDR